MGEEKSCLYRKLGEIMVLFMNYTRDSWVFFVLIFCFFLVSLISSAFLNFFSLEFSSESESILWNIKIWTLILGSVVGTNSTH